MLPCSLNSGEVNMPAEDIQYGMHNGCHLIVVISNELIIVIRINIIDDGNKDVADNGSGNDFMNRQGEF